MSGKGKTRVEQEYSSTILRKGLYIEDRSLEVIAQRFIGWIYLTGKLPDILQILGLRWTQTEHCWFIVCVGIKRCL